MRPRVGKQGQALVELGVVMVLLVPLFLASLGLITRAFGQTQCQQQAFFAAGWLKIHRPDQISVSSTLRYSFQWSREPQSWKLTARCPLRPITWQIPDVE